MICLIALGSNLGPRPRHLENAARKLRAVSRDGYLRVSPIFETRPLLPGEAPREWRLPFLNAVVEIDFMGSPRELLQLTQIIELDLGRTRAARWAPRVIDVDVLICGDEVVHDPDLTIPHADMNRRQFVLAPLKHLRSRQALMRSRALGDQLPLWMGVMNLTPDSFSDGGELTHDLFVRRVHSWTENGVHAFDLGAESTRAGATPVTPDEEWRRLGPALFHLRERHHGLIFRPLVSVDTRHALTAERAIEMGVDILNDVSGLSDSRMLELLKSSRVQYVLMHSKSVPSQPGASWEVRDPVSALRAWALRRIEWLDREGVSLERVIFDPGIGFGKSRTQSLEILQRIDELLDLPVRLMISHSRKSFMEIWGTRPAHTLDPETIGSSLRLAAKGVDILRVHAPEEHVRAWRAFEGVK